MTNAVKKKFIAITLTLLIALLVVFAGIIGWIAIEHSKSETRNIMVVMLDAVSTIENSGETGQGSFISEYADEAYLITKLIVSPDKEIIYRNTVGGKGEGTISDDVVNTILSADEDEWNYGRYVFCSTSLDDGSILYLIVNYMDTKAQRSAIIKIIIAFIAGIILLALITVYLSRFVTKPAEEALEREKRFVADASHELKTPLSAIAVNAQILEKKDEENQQIKSIITETDRMSKMIEKMLTLSYLDAMEQDMSKTVDLSLIAKEISLTYESIAYEKNIAVTCEIEDNIKVKGNQDELYRLVVILVDNAIKNTPESGTISISLSRKQHVVLEVENTGKGISEDVLPHVFERFYTTGASREDSSFGLGLAIAKAITDNHRGTITAASDGKEKTLFSVILE